MKYVIKHKFWSGKMELWKDENIIGYIKTDNIWKGHVVGYLYESKYFFMRKGAFNTSIEIVDELENVIGEIKYATWTNKAEISVHGKRYTWSSINFWGTKWKLVDELEREIVLENKEFHVNYSSYEDNEFLFLLSSFLLYNYHTKMAAAT